ncbi:MAG: tripartite tricarboxylate transporter TctB family protein [Geminicoccaceae bacterium]|nr:tripartite tricarboxylate transporter TctB family protein [Geminicoccaceae bacterium]
MPGRRAGIAFALAILALAALVAVEATRIPHSAYAVVGPRFFPFAVAGLLGLLGLLLLLQALAGGLLPADFAGEPFDRRAVAWVGLGLFLNVALIQSLGFVLASSLLFLCVARGFGSTRPIRHAALGFLLATLVFLGFSRLLGVRFGGGLVEGLLGAGA